MRRCKLGTGQEGIGVAGEAGHVMVSVRRCAERCFLARQARWRALGLGLVMYGKAGGVRCVQVRNGVGLSRLERSLYGR